MNKYIFKQAHKKTKKLLKKGDSYSATFKLVLKLLFSMMKNKMYKVTKTLITVDRKNENNNSCKVEEVFTGTFSDTRTFINKKRNSIIKNATDNKVRQFHTKISGYKKVGNLSKNVSYSWEEISEPVETKEVKRTKISNLLNELNSLNLEMLSKGLNVRKDLDNELVKRYHEIHSITKERYGY